jgi:autotransporter-associated beta strand protein
MSDKTRPLVRHPKRLIFSAFLAIYCCAPAAAQVDPLSFVHIIPVTDNNPATDDLGFDHYINSTSFKIQSLVTVDKYQFIAYYDQGTSNTNRNVTIARRDITNPTNVWTITHTAFTSNDSTDAHDVISMGIDGAGFLHTSWGMHNNNLLYTKSTASVLNDNPMNFVGQATGNSAAINTMTGANETSVTYPNFYSIPGTEDLLFNYRTGSSGDGIYRISRYNAATKTWSFTNQDWIARTDSRGLSYNAYPHNMIYDSHGGLHASWTFRYNSDSPAGEIGYQTNHNIYYGYSPDNGATWYRDPAGTIPYGGVIDDVTSQIAIPIPEGSSLINTGTMAVDSHDNPVIATYWAPHAHDTVPDNRRQYMFAYYDGSNWKQSQITNRRVDDPAIKTAETALPDSWMGRPQLMIDDYNRAFVVYNDNEGMTNVTVAVSQAASRDDWETYELTSVPTTIGTDTIELTYDRARWQQDRTMSLFYQPQIGGNASPVSVLEWNTQQALGRVLKWTGRSSSTWNGTSSNFTDQSTPDDFDNFDNVTFDDSSTQRTVLMAQATSAGKVVVDTKQTYVFLGSGLTAGSLAVVGGGTLELRNSGNTYAGPTRVSNATLRILGDAGDMRSKINVATGGVVVLDAANTASMTSNFDVWKTGELQIGSANSGDHIFPANANQIVNDGTVRVFSSETLTNVSGDGSLVAESRTLTLQSNSSFAGTVVANDGATVIANNSTSFGTAGLDVAGNGSGSGAVRVLNAAQVNVTKTSTLRTAQATVFVDAGANLTFSGRVNGAGGLAKAGAGTMSLTAESSYAGQTVVQAGILTVDGTTGSGDTHVQSTGTLAGRGRIAANLAAHSGSIVRPTPIDINVLGGSGFIDDFNDASLSEYTQYTVLNFDGVIESTFSAAGGAIQASTIDTGNSPEQTAFVRPFGGLAVGQTLVADAAINPNNGTPRPVQLFDYGLLLADSRSLHQGTRQQYLYAASRLSSSPDIMLARYWDSDPVDGSPADVNVNNGAGVNIETPRATQFYIKRIAQSTYQLGYSTDNLQSFVQYGPNVTVQSTFEPDLVGFYSDARGGDNATTQTANSGTFDNLRIISPGNTSTVFTVAGDFTLDSGGTLEIKLMSDHEYGKINIVGTLHANGTLNVQLAPGFQPTAGASFDILDFGADTGLFELARLPVLSSGLVWDTSKLMTEGRLYVVSGLTGDYNGDGIVDTADYVTWRKSMDAVGVGLSADGNRDLHVDQADYDLWRAHFGQTAGSAGARDNAAIPEPTTSLSLLVGVSVLCFRRRGHSN